MIRTTGEASCVREGEQQTTEGAVVCALYIINSVFVSWLLSASPASRGTSASPASYERTGPLVNRGHA